jgi:hypothetical protein
MPTATVEIAGPREVEAMLHGLAKVCAVQLLGGRVRVGLYSSGVVYRREPLGREIWQSAWQTLMRGHGDCEDLVAWRVAELWVAGETGAMPKCYAPRPGLIHCVVRRASGKIEDPSKKLGMGKP